MNTRILKFAILAGITGILAFSCDKNEPSAADVAPAKVCHITVSAEKAFGQDTDVPESKVTYDPSTNILALEADDKLQVLLFRWIDPDAKDGVYSKQVVLDQVGTTGVFEGTIDFTNETDSATPFTIDDIRGFVLVKAEKTDWTGTSCNISGTKNLCIAIAAQTEQTQSAAGVFNSGTQFAFYSGKTSTVEVSQDGDDINIKNVKLNVSTAIWEYHVYADAPVTDETDYASERIISVQPEIDPTSTNVSVLTGKFFWNETSNTSRRGYTGTSLSSNVSLDTPAPVPVSKEDAAIIWHSLAPGASKSLKAIKVITDKATYYKSLDKTIGGTRGKVYPININLATCDRHPFAKTIEYSVDNGTTWLETLPTDATTYTALAVRSGNLTATQLEEIDTWIRNQDGTVDLDLSGCFYQNTVFPRVFGTDGTDANPANTKLASILFPVNITSLEQFAFRQCSALKSANMENLVKLGGSTFRGCTSLLVANLPECTTFGTYDFSVASALTSVSAPKLTAAGNYSFYRTCALTNVNLPLVASIGTYAFALGDATEPAALVSLNLPSVTSIGNYAFNKLHSLQSISVPEVTSIGTYSFEDCSSLQSISVPEATTIGEYAFHNCISLESITFPKVATIGQYAFYNCSVLDNINIPASCTNTGNWTFRGCYGITEATINATLTAAPTSSATANTRLFAEGESGGSPSTPAMHVTFGPDVLFTSARCFQFNKKVTRVTFEGSTYIGYGFFGGAENLKTIEFKGAAKAGSGTLTYNSTNGPVPKNGTIYISKDAEISDFSGIAPFKTLVGTHSWTIVKSTEW